MSTPARIVTPAEAGWRLDRLVAALPSVASRRRAREAVETGKVSLNGETTTDPARPLRPGDAVVVDWNRAGTAAAHHKAAVGLAEAGVRILYEDDQVIAADKPPGLLTDSASVEQARTRDTLRRRLGALVREEGDRLHIVHRIDKDTSGVVLAARTARAAERLREQFFRGSPQRQYLALIEGALQPAAGAWADWMAWDSAQHLQRPAQAGWEGAVLARAQYQTRESLRGASLIEVSIQTGRRNQIRLHCQLRGHPILGEPLYREGPPRGPRAPRLALHAWRLTVTHPTTGAPLTIESPLAADLEALRAALRR